MKIEFEQFAEAAAPNARGGEGVFRSSRYTDDRIRIIRGRLEPGSSIGMHVHTGTSEVIYLLSGKGKVLCDGGEERMLPGDCHYCPEGRSHSLINDGTEELTFFAVVPLYE